MYFFSHCHRKAVIKLFEAYIEATITAIIKLLEFFPHTSRDSKKRWTYASHCIDFEPRMVSNKEAKILNPSGYHKVYSLIFEMCMYIVKQDMHVANQDNGNQVLSEWFLKECRLLKEYWNCTCSPAGLLSKLVCQRKNDNKINWR